MKISKNIAAKVSAYFTQWVDPEEFAESAEKGLIYQQRHHITQDKLFSFYVIDREFQEVPLDQLVHADNLTVVLPYDAVIPETLSFLSSLEQSRRQKEGEHLYEIQIIGQTGSEYPSQEVRYACISFSLTEELAARVIASRNKTVGGQDKRAVTDIRKLTADEIRIAIKDIFKPFEKSGSVTLKEIERFIPVAKEYKIMNDG